MLIETSHAYHITEVNQVTVMIVALLMVNYTIQAVTWRGVQTVKVNKSVATVTISHQLSRRASS
jgi:hypothetical protein